MKSDPCAVAIPAGEPGPDGAVRRYPVYADAFDLLYPSAPSRHLRVARPSPAPLTIAQRVERVERIVLKLAKGGRGCP
jgi:hypothetical protein